MLSLPLGSLPWQSAGGTRERTALCRMHWSVARCNELSHAPPSPPIPGGCWTCWSQDGRSHSKPARIHITPKNPHHTHRSAQHSTSASARGIILPPKIGIAASRCLLRAIPKFMARALSRAHAGALVMVSGGSSLFSPGSRSRSLKCADASGVPSPRPPRATPSTAACCSLPLPSTAAAAGCGAIKLTGAPSS